MSFISIASHITLLFYAMPCYYAMLCYAIAMLCYAMLCYAMLCYAILSYPILSYPILSYTILYYIILYYIFSPYFNIFNCSSYTNKNIYIHRTRNVSKGHNLAQNYLFPW
jgi:hypothetical protein